MWRFWCPHAMQGIRFIQMACCMKKNEWGEFFTLSLLFMPACIHTFRILSQLLLLEDSTWWIVTSHSMCSSKYPYPTIEGVLILTLPHPSENSSLVSYHPLKILAFETPPLPRNSQWPSMGWGINIFLNAQYQILFNFTCDFSGCKHLYMKKVAWNVKGSLKSSAGPKKFFKARVHGCTRFVCRKKLHADQSWKLRANSLISPLGFLTFFHLLSCKINFFFLKGSLTCQKNIIL